MTVNQTAAPEGGSLSEHPPKRKGMRLGCKILLGLFLIGLTLAVVVVILVANAFSWLSNAKEDKIADYAPIHLSAVDELELEKAYVQIRQSQINKAEFEIRLKPEQLNVFAEREMKKKDREGHRQQTDPIAFRLSFEGDQTVTTLAEGGGYTNIKMSGHLRVRDRKLKVHVEELEMANRKAPWLVMKIVEYVTSGLEEGRVNGSVELDEFLDTVKVLEREGDQIHLILNGEKLTEAEDASGAKEAEATGK